MGCNNSVAASGNKPLLLRFNDAKVKARLQEVLLKSFDGISIVGLPTIVKGEYTLNDAPEPLQDLHYGIEDYLAAAPMRLLKISSVLSSTALTCYEDVKSTDYLEIAYSKVTDDMWQRIVALSWRWNKSKPKTKASEFSPMSSDQFEELCAILREAEKHGLEWIWIDWSCVVQYVGDPIIEIQRSRLYYMVRRSSNSSTQSLADTPTLLMQRCGAFIVVSDFTDIPDSGPVKVLLVKVLRKLKKSVGEKGDEDSVIEQALVKVLEVVLEKKTVASLEYFCRAWTLAVS